MNDRLALRYVGGLVRAVNMSTNKGLDSPAGPMGQSEYTAARENDPMTLQELFSKTLADGGGTFRTDTFHPVTAGGWAVGKARGIPTATFPADDIGPGGFAGGRTQRAVWDIVDSGAGYIGTWVDDGTLYIDAVDIIEDPGTAIEVGYARGEKAIYHLTLQRTLRLE